MDPYRDIRRATMGDYFVYCVELLHTDDGFPKFYVGSTQTLQMRLHDHFTGSPESTEWVRRWGGAKREVTTRRTTAEDRCGAEVAMATEMKCKYGWNNVRGALDCNPGDSSRAIPRYWRVPPSGLTPRSARPADADMAGDIDQNEAEHPGGDEGHNIAM